MAIVAIEALRFGLNKIIEACSQKLEHFYLLTHDPSLYDHELINIDNGSMTVITVDTQKEEDVLSALEKIQDIHGILNLTDTWCEISLKAIEKYDCVRANHDAIRLTRDKHALRNVLNKNGLSSGWSINVNLNDPSILKEIKLPVILKDSSGTGSQNIWLARTYPELTNSLAKIKKEELRGNIMIESYFSGTLYSIETISWQGEIKVLAISSRMMTPEPDFLEVGISAPINFPDKEKKDLYTWISKILDLIGYSHGFTHTEFMITDGNIEVVEINPRLGGSRIGESLCEIYNYNVYKAFIEMALNKKPELFDVELVAVKGMAEVSVFAQNTGYYTGVNGLELLTHHPGNPIFYPTAKTGKKIISTRDSRAYVGVLSASGETSELAMQNVLAGFVKISVCMQKRNLSAKPHLLLVGGWTAIIEKAVKNNFDVSYIGGCESRPGFNADILKKCHFVHTANIEHIGICLLIAKKIHAAQPIDAVISFSEAGVESASIISSTLHINGLDFMPTMLTRYKQQMRAALDDYPELVVPWKFLENCSDLQKFFGQHGPKIIVKPMSGAGSVGAVKIKSEHSLNEFISNNKPAIDVGKLIAEKLIDSDRMFSIETLSINGEHNVISISDMFLTGDPYALILQIVMPPIDLSNSETIALKKCAIEFLTAIGLNNGTAHTEIKVANHIPYIIESQTRVGGDRIWEMTELTTGIDQIGYALRNLLEPVSLPKASNTGKVAGLLAFLPPPGTVKQIANIDLLVQQLAVREYENHIVPGGVIEKITDNNSRKGHVYLTADSHDELYSAFSKITKNMWVEYEDGTIWQPTFKQL